MENLNGDVLSKEEAAADISFIKETIEAGRTVLIESGLSFVLWGAVILAGILGCYALSLAGLYNLILPMWGLDYVIGACVFFFVYRSGAINRGNRSFVGRVYGAAWTAVAISTSIFMVLYAVGELGLDVFLGVVSLGVGIAYFVSSSLTHYRWLRGIAVCWWLGAIGFFFVPFQYLTILMGGLVLLFELIPGIFMYKAGKAKFHAA